MAFAEDDKVIQTILASKVGSCNKAEEIYKNLEDKKIMNLSPGPTYRISYFEVYGTLKNGSRVLLELTWVMNCNPYSNTGCVDAFQCHIKSY